MAVTSILSISEFGLNYQKQLVNIATTNISMANVAQPDSTNAFKPLYLTVNDSFSNQMNSDSIEVAQSNSALIQRHQPNHPSADDDGNVRYANIDIAQEMIRLTQASRSYEANVQAFNSQMSMIMKSLEIGK